MRGHDAYRGAQAFRRPSRNAAVVRQLVVVWDERRSFILHLLRRFGRPSCSGLRSDETRSTQFESYDSTVTRCFAPRLIEARNGLPVGMAWRLLLRRKAALPETGILRSWGVVSPIFHAMSVLKWLRPLGDHKHLPETFETHAGPQLPTETTLLEES